MYSRRRRPPIDFEILQAKQEVEEISESMELLDPELVEEVRVSFEHDELYMRRIARMLKMINPKLSDIAIMSKDDGRQQIVLLFEDKSAVPIRRKRTAQHAIHDMVKICSLAA